MQKNDLLKKGDSIIRILAMDGECALIMNCMHPHMPKWLSLSELDGYAPSTEKDLYEATGTVLYDIEALDASARKAAYERYTVIAGILPYLADESRRAEAIHIAAERFERTEMTVRKYLCRYLVFDSVSALAPKPTATEKELTQTEKVIRWGLNKFYYTAKKHSLRQSYTLLLKEKFCDETGQLKESYPTFSQYRYFYYTKYRDIRKQSISRDGLKEYQKNVRPLLGDGVQAFAPAVGVGMCDATILDIYLIDEAGNAVGRPVLTACLDAYSRLLMGYILSWEGGTYSLALLMDNVIADKVQYCMSFGIVIEPLDWGCHELPGVIVTDRGSEYTGETFEQICELGVRIVNLPAFRPELKCIAEEFFNMIQSYYKPHLKGRGVIEPDYQQRGAPDYRKQARLTMDQFHRVLLYAIIYYNTRRIIESFPYTQQMLNDSVAPHANAIWNWGKRQPGANLISVVPRQLRMTLLPRTTGTFKRDGLHANRLRYRRDDYTERYLRGGKVIVAYNPDDCTWIWLFENGKYIEFRLIEARYNGLSVSEVQKINSQKSELVQSYEKDNLQAQIDLAAHIEAVVESAAKSLAVNLKDIRETRRKAKVRAHKNMLEDLNDE